MPKSRSRPQKRTRTTASPRGNPAVLRHSTRELFIVADDLVNKDELGTPEDWQRLRESFLAQYPSCPDCGAAWDLELAIDDLYPLDGEISMLVPCLRYEAEVIEGREPPPHSHSGGLIRHTVRIP